MYNTRYGDSQKDDIGNTMLGGSPNGVKGPLLHIKDVVVKAEGQIDAFAPIKTIIERVAQASRQSKFMLEYGRPDLAYSEHLVATIILANIIPRHKDAPSVDSRLLKQLTSKHYADQDQFDKVKELIVRDNEVNRTVSQHAQAQDLSYSHRGSFTARIDSKQRMSSGDQYRNKANAIRDVSDERTVQRNSAAITPCSTLGDAASRPNSGPPGTSRPQNFNSTSIAFRHSSGPGAANPAGTSVDTLSERFARLRMGGVMSPHSPYRAAAEMIDHDLGYSDTNSTAGHFGASSELSSTTSRTSEVIGKSSATSVSPKRSNVAKDLPKPPSPTYSPTRTTAPVTQSSRATTSSFSSSSTKRPSSSTSVQNLVVYKNPTDGAIASQHIDSSNGQNVPARRRRKTINLPQETEISADRLFDYLKKYNVLLIDVRSREVYDSGHIFAAASMCIEPAALRPNMSADELQEALILSPDKEQDMLFQRDKFDLVVYYDQASSLSPVQRPYSENRNVALRYLHDALCEYNHDKPLLYPPVILLGGLNAWVSLMGEHALAMSNTTILRSARTSDTSKGRTSANGTTRFSLPRKRYRDYNPLDAEEVTKWRERARSESVGLNARPQVEEENDEDTNSQSTLQFLRTYEEFYQRFPDVASVEQQSMISHPPTRRPPERPQTSHQTLSTTPAPLPSIPLRPPPAVPRPSYSGVTERAAATSQPVSNAAKLPAYIPPKLLRLPKTGLYNFGATCYMNATVQCLSATIPLTSFFLDGQWHKYLQKSNWKGSKGIIPEFYEILLRNLWITKDVDTIRPTNFRKFCARLNKEWGSDRQQDAKEFLEFLLDCLHEDFNSNWAHAPLQTLTTEEEARRERMAAFVAAKIEWERYLHRDNSRITDLFAGQHISRLQCNSCRHSSTTYEPFYSISVEIPSGHHQNVNIYDCMRSYCSAEMLSGDEVWRCPRCRAEREATKRITISRAPEFLVIHFKRFSASHGDRARKITTAIDFPLTGFDLEPYMLPPPDETQKDQILRSHGSKHLDMPTCMTPPYQYNAYAIIRHLGGTMTSGHYISLVRDPARGKWREFNDDRIRDFHPADLPESKRLQNEQAYIVFYQRAHL